jgi:hypothetical protein
MSKESVKGTAVLEEAASLPDASPNYWQMGLTSFNNGDPATTAMQTIYNAMFPANLTLVAEIVGALYADHYFVNTQLSSAMLANELSASLGKNPADCQRAANIAFSQWYGLSVRANLADTAAIPRPGSLTSSPDILVNGITPIPVSTLIQQWNQTTWGPISGDKNLVYGRAGSVNISVPITKAEFSLFTTDAGLNNPPNQWTQLFTHAESRTSTVQTIGGATTLQPGDRGAISDPFVWDVPGSGHYCLIAVARTEFFTNDPALIQPSNWNSLTWITYNGAAGWHNVDVVSSNEEVLKIYNQDGTRETYEFEADCTNVPIGTEVSIAAEDPVLPAIIRSHAVRISGNEQVVRAAGELPGNYKGDLTIRFKTPDGKLLPAPASVAVNMYWVVPPGHAHYEDAVAMVGDTQAIALNRRMRLHVGSFTFVGTKK